MSAKIRISYKTPEELQEILEHLKPIIGKIKVASEKKGSYERAYVDVKSK